MLFTLWPNPNSFPTPTARPTAPIVGVFGALVVSELAFLRGRRSDLKLGIPLPVG